MEITGLGTSPVTRSQLKFQNLHFCNGGTPVSWFLAKSGFPSEGENPVCPQKNSLGLFYDGGMFLYDSYFYRDY